MELKSAIDDLYRLAVSEQKSTSTKRLSFLANYCVAQLALRGLVGAESEITIDGGGRPKDWDVAAGKYRLVISLKSILKNVSGTVPNRIDDLMGETANIQLYSPEIVAGYLLILDVSQDRQRAHGRTWYDTLMERLTRLSGRRAPYWTPSTFESFSVVRVDFSRGCTLVDSDLVVHKMFDELVAETHKRNPGIQEMSRGA
jgi:hypothetical protein